MRSKKRDFEPQKLKDVLQHFIDQKPLKKGITKVRLVLAWKEVMGNNVQAYTDQIDLVGKRLYVQLRSAPLKNELHFSQKTIVEKLNEHIGETVISQLIFR